MNNILKCIDEIDLPCLNCIADTLFGYFLSYCKYKIKHALKFFGVFKNLA